MYAIIKTGGKQYKVQPGQSVRVEKLEQALGSEFDLTEVLLVGGENPVVGQPLVKDAKVTVVVTKQAKDKKAEIEGTALIVLNVSNNCISAFSYFPPG